MPHSVLPYQPSGFVKLTRSAETLSLIDHHPNAFLLLSKLALLASRSETQTGLQPGQVRLTNSFVPGLTRQQFRTAMGVLVANQLVTYSATNANHTVTLCSTGVYDVNLGGQQPTRQPTVNQGVSEFNTPYSIYRQEGQEKEKVRMAHTRVAGATKDGADTGVADPAGLTSPTGQTGQTDPARPVPAESPKSAKPPKPTGQPARCIVSTGPVHPDAFAAFWALFPNKTGADHAMLEWNQLGLDRAGYEDVVCKLRGHIDSADYFNVTDSKYQKAPAAYLRDRRFEDIADKTRPYRRTYQYVIDRLVEWGKLDPGVLYGQQAREVQAVKASRVSTVSTPSQTNTRLRA